MKMNKDKAFAFLLFSITLLMLISPVFAINIDAQSTTFCLKENCITTVNLSNYMSYTDIISVKSFDLSNSKPEIDIKSGIKEFNYKFTGDSILLSGKITEGTNNYWNFDLKNGYVIDPWWNYTVSTEYLLELPSWDDNNQGGGANYWGIAIKPNTTIELKSILIAPYCSDLNVLQLYFCSNSSYIANSTKSGTRFNFSQPVLYPNVEYCIAGSSTLRTYGNDAFPVTDALHYNVTGSIGGATPNAVRTDFGFSVIQVVTTLSSETSTFYENHLYLSGVEGNNTISNTTQLNSTLTSNLTDVPVLIYIDNVLSANSTETATNLTYLPEGTYNITGFVGNTSTNETITYYATITYTAPVIIGYVYCINNETLAHINVTNLQTDNLISYYENCEYGCDNVTFSCFPAPFIQDLITFLILCGFAVIGVLAFKWLK